MTFGEFNPRLATFGAVCAFKAPLPLPEFLTRKDNTETDENDQTQDQSSENNEYEEEQEPLDVTFKAGVVGSVVRQRVPYYLSYADRDEEVKVQVSLSNFRSSSCFANWKF